MKIRGDKGQVTIFVIIAIVVVGALILFFTASDAGRGILEGFTDTGDFDVRGSIQNCVEDNEDIQNLIDNLLEHGGNVDPEFAYLFEGRKLTYLCYTGNFYETCINQQPLLLQHVEAQLFELVEEVAQDCIKNTNDELKSRNYEVTSSTSQISIDLVPGSLIIQINYPLIISKNDNVRQYSGFEIRKKTNAYDLIVTSVTIVNFESEFGESDPNDFMYAYPTIKVEKLKQENGITVYKVSDRETKESFNFAVRSLVFPVGYGF